MRTERLTEKERTEEFKMREVGNNKVGNVQNETDTQTEKDRSQ